jgi:two-component SAPR family response regulator
MNQKKLQTLQDQKERLRNSWAKHHFSQSNMLKHAVVIDDDPCALMILRKYLQSIGFSSIDTFTGEFEALEFVSHHSPDLIVLDCNLKSTSGLKLAPMLTTLLGPMFQILMISADKSFEYKMQQLNMECPTRFLSKPLNFNQFEKTVSEIM